MSRMMLGLLAMGAATVALAGPAVAQECEQDRVANPEAKQWRCSDDTEQSYTFAPTVWTEVPRGQQRPGDVRGFKYVGKRTERAYFREVERPNPAFAQGHECHWRPHYQGKRTTYEFYCVVNGVEEACLGMDRYGHCLAHREIPRSSFN